MTVRFIILNGENDRLTYKYVSRILGTYHPEKTWRLLFVI